MDDDATPTLKLKLTPNSVVEDGGRSVVTASLTGQSSETVEIVLGVTPQAPARNGDFTVEFQGLQDDDDEDEQNSRQGSADGAASAAGGGWASAAGAADERVLAASDPTAGPPDGARLTIAPGATASTETVAIVAVPDKVDTPAKVLVVAAADLSGGNGVAAPLPVNLTIADDDATPTSLTLAVVPPTVREADDPTEFSVTATLKDEIARHTETVVAVTVARRRRRGDVGHRLHGRGTGAAHDSGVRGVGHGHVHGPRRPRMPSTRTTRACR